MLAEAGNTFMNNCTVLDLVGFAEPSWFVHLLLNIVLSF